MSELTEDFEFRPRKSGNGQVADGDWHGEDIQVLTADGPQDEAMATLDELYRSWSAWSRMLVKAIEKAHGDPGDYWLEAITAYCGDGYEGYFEIEFSSPDLFGEDIALAVGTLKGGFEDVGVGG